MLIKIFYDFWSFWFVSENFQLPENWLMLLSLISTLATVWLCLIRPIVKLIRR